MSRSPAAAETAACAVTTTYAVDCLNDFQTGLKVTVSDGIPSLPCDFLFHKPVAELDDLARVTDS